MTPSSPDPAFWGRQTILLTGGNGFLGHHLREALEPLRPAKVFAPRSADYDLMSPGAAARLLDDTRPTLVFHLAALCGGIGANRAHPGSFFYANALMGLQLLEAARTRQTPKLVIAGTICAYPKFTPVPFREDDLWNGYPEETNAPYGLAKKMLLVQAQAYRQEYGCNFIYLLPVNLYGPRDNFDPETSHVIPALIRKMEEARLRGGSEVALWGTGSASREFLHARDCARGLAMAAERYDAPDPVNLGAGAEITIRDLAEKIRTLTGFGGRIAWDPSKPDGQPRRALCTARAMESFGFRAQTPLDDGLRETIAWYRQNAPR